MLITCGLVALKFRLNRAQRQIIPLWEQVPSWSGLEYEAATITPVAFQETSEIYRFCSEAKSRFSKVTVSLDSLLKKMLSSSLPYPAITFTSTLIDGHAFAHLGLDEGQSFPEELCEFFQHLLRLCISIFFLFIGLALLAGVLAPGMLLGWRGGS